MNRTYKDRLKFIGFLLVASAFLLRNTLFPDNSRHGHWFWIAVLGVVLYFTGFLWGRLSHD
jgi:hypothetical protein